MWLYFCMERQPIGGNIPHDGLYDADYFDRRREVKEVGLCWGFCIYTRELSEEECRKYGLFKHEKGN